MPTQIAELQAALEAHLATETGGPVSVVALEPLGGGACQDNYRVEIDLEGKQTLVLRSDARRSLPGSLSRREEFAVIGAAVAAGVKTPRARWLAQDLVRPGAWGYLLDWVDGTAIGRRVLRDAELEGARRGLTREVAAELAKIHSIRPENATGIGLGPVSVVAFTRQMVDAMREPRPAIELALRWLEDNPPEDHDTTLVHGDFRTGNFMVTPGGLSGVLDWEFAHWGSPAEDLAWITMRNWRFGKNKLPVGGFGARDDFYEAYEKAGGKRVNRRDVHHWEVAGNVRWAAGCALQGERYLSGEESDLELIAIPRRGVEMEFEALRLIEKGPS